MASLGLVLSIAAVFLGLIAVIMHGIDMKRRTNKKQSGEVVKIYYFYAPWCGYCKKFFPMWNKLKQQHGNIVEMIEINSDENKKMCAEYGVSMFPTIIKEKSSGKREKFEEERTEKKLIKFIQS